MVLAQKARMCGFCCAVPPKRSRGNSVALHGHRAKMKSQATLTLTFAEQHFRAFAGTIALLLSSTLHL